MNNYEGNEIDKTQENTKLSNILEKVAIFEKECSEDYDFYEEYLITLAKRKDVLNNKIATQIYIKSSEEIIKFRIKKFLKQEKHFIIFNEIIYKLKNFFDI